MSYFHFEIGPSCEYMQERTKNSLENVQNREHGICCQLNVLWVTLFTIQTRMLISTETETLSDHRPSCELVKKGTKITQKKIRLQSSESVIS